MKKLLIVIFAIIAIWDAFTTFIGVDGITQSSGNGITFSIIASLLVFAFMLGTNHILNFEGMIGKLLKVFWGIAILIDVITSFIGNSIFINANDWLTWIILLLITLLTSASGIIVSYMYGGDGNKPNRNFSIEI